MKYQAIESSPQSITSDCVVVGITTDGLSPHAKKLDKASKGALSRAFKYGDISNQIGRAHYLHGLEGIKSPRVMLLGCGKQEQRDELDWVRAITTACKQLRQGGSTNAAFYLDDIKIKGRSLSWALQMAAQVMTRSDHRPGELKSTTENLKRLKTIQFYTGKKTAAARKALTTGQAIGKGMLLACRLGDLPANIATPSYLASVARKLARSYTQLNAHILNEKQMEKLGMRSLLSVAAGSEEPAKLIILNYQGTNPSTPPIALVGKGVTFDTGGISLKPGAAMDEMKYDMCGAASVLGSIQAVAQLKLPINVVGLMPATENMPSGRATKPGDIVTSMSGQTIEILNTDAEGRLILCDALTYAQKKYKPQAIIDIATLTGAVIVALGSHVCGLMGNHEKLSKAIISAGQDTQDIAWELPMDTIYQKQLDSRFADMANIGGRGAGTIVAACFLSRFITNTPWVHLDIAGTAWNSGSNKGASGRPVPLLTQFLINHANNRDRYPPL